MTQRFLVEILTEKNRLDRLTEFDDGSVGRVLKLTTGKAFEGSVSKVEMATPMALIYKVFFPIYIHV